MIAGDPEEVIEPVDFMVIGAVALVLAVKFAESVTRPPAAVSFASSTIPFAPVDETLPETVTSVPDILTFPFEVTEPLTVAKPLAVTLMSGVVVPFVLSPWTLW